MSIATKRKHVTKEVTEEFVLPSPNQQIVKIAGGRGNNLHEAVTPEGQSFLVSMPTKFRKNVWIKRGDFVIVDPIEEGDKVKAEITRILYKEQIKYIKRESLWPSQFDSYVKPDNTEAMIPDDMLPPSDDDEYDSEEGETGCHGHTLLRINNPNRRVQIYAQSDDSEEEEEEENDQ